MSAREPSSIWDRPVSNAELQQFNGVEITDTAIAIGEQHVLADMDLIGDFIAGASSERKPSKFFGNPISDVELVQLVLGTNAPDQQRAEAAKELRARYLADCQPLVMKRAMEVSYA